jgi:hypothetical protein
MTKREALEQFKSDILPEVIKKYGKDKVAICEAWNEWTDYLCKDRQITPKQYNNWTNPF